MSALACITERGLEREVKTNKQTKKKYKKNMKTFFSGYVKMKNVRHGSRDTGENQRQ